MEKPGRVPLAMCPRLDLLWVQTSLSRKDLRQPGHLWAPNIALHVSRALQKSSTGSEINIKSLREEPCLEGCVPDPCPPNMVGHHFTFVLVFHKINHHFWKFWLQLGSKGQIVKSSKELEMGIHFYEPKTKMEINSDLSENLFQHFLNLVKKIN